MLLSSALLSLVLCLSLEKKKAHADIIDGEWLIKRGGVDSTWLTNLMGDANESVKENSNFLHMDKDITLEDARKWCAENEDCVAFSFNIKSRKSMRTIDSVFYLFDVEDASRGDFSTRPWFSSTAAGWVTHVLHEEGLEWNGDAPECQSSVAEEMELEWNEEEREYDEDVSPYKHCCHHVNTRRWVPKHDQIREMETIQRISCDISRDEFVEKYESKRIPVILEGCDKDWPAKENWKDFQTLAPRFHNDTKMLACWQENMTWAEIQDDMDNYLCIFHKNKGEVMEPLRQNYTVPRPFQNADIFRHLVDVDKNDEHFPQFPISYFSVRTALAASTVHHDCIFPAVENWNTLVQGHVWWILFPDTKALSHVNAVNCTPACSSDIEPFAWLATVGVNADKLVFEDGQRPMHVLQGPGDTVYLPDRWMHGLLSLDKENVAITGAYSSAESNFARVWKEILVWGRDGDWEKLYDTVLTEDQRRIARDTIKGERVCVSNSSAGCIGAGTKCRNSTFFSRVVQKEDCEE